MQGQIHPISAATSVAGAGAGKVLEVLVTALMIYFAISIGVMQMKTAPAPVLHSASGQAETVLI